MNDLIAFLNSHGSCRKFTDTPITPEQEMAIITTAQRSPTSSNLQAYSIIGIRDQARKDTLAGLCGDQAHISKAALFLIFCADLHRLSRLNEQRGYRFNGGDTEAFIVATVDASLAACRALAAAQALGFGGVMVGGIRNHPDEVGTLVNLPRLVYPVMGMSLGEPEAPPKIKPRLDPDAIYMREEYDESESDRLVAAYDKTMGETGYLSRRPVEPEKYPDFEGEYSWSEHTARRMASERAGVRRTHMLEYLKSLGFLQQ